MITETSPPLNLPARRVARLLWLYQLPGLTARVVLAAAKALRLAQVIEVDDGEGGVRRVTLSPKVAEVIEEQWLEFRDECARRVGIEDFDAWEAERLRESPAYREWLKERRAWQRKMGVRDVGA
jgi:hypothetical protein